MLRNLLVATALVAGLSLSVASSQACDPKDDPSCDRGTDAVAAAPAPCNPKTDPGCGN